MIDQKHIRNFSIIAHIDHGKSTLSDRLIEKCGAVEQRIMEDQILSADEPINSVGDYIRLVKAGRMTPFLQPDPKS